MIIQDVERIVGEGIEEITVTASALADAKPRASRYLVRLSLLATFLKELEEELPKYRTIENAQYAQVIQVCPGKTITEKKVNSELAPEYTNAREQREKLEALREWVKTHIKIFDHAHLMYRQYSRD